MASRHDYFYEFQLSGKNPHHARYVAEIAKDKAGLPERRAEALAPFKRVRLIAVLGAIAVSLLALFVGSTFDLSWLVTVKMLSVSLLALPVWGWTTLVIYDKNGNYDAWSENYDNEIRWSEDMNPEGWWAELCKDRTAHVKTWRRHWYQFRAGNGGFDLYIREHCKKEGLSWHDFQRVLKSDYRDYFQFIQRETRVVELQCENGAEMHRLPLRFWLQRRMKEDKAAGKPTSIREAEGTRSKPAVKTRTTLRIVSGRAHGSRSSGTVGTRRR